jgi:hypothetical protein
MTGPLHFRASVTGAILLMAIRRSLPAGHEEKTGDSAD